MLSLMLIKLFSALFPLSFRSIIIVQIHLCCLTYGAKVVEYELRQGKKGEKEREREGE